MTSTPDTQTTTAPEQPANGRCLVCSTVQFLEPSGRITGHMTDNEEHAGSPVGTRWFCAGSRHPRQSADGKDPVRRRAAIQSSKLRAEADAAKRDMQAQSTGWQMADLVTYWTHRILPLEENSRRWAQLAVHGLWPVALKDALADLSQRYDSTSKLDNAVGELKRGAARDWLRAIRWDVAEHFADGLTEEDLTTILFSI